jgi:hypothetical protein
LSFGRPILEEVNLAGMMKSVIKENAPFNRKARRALQARVWGSGWLRKGIPTGPAEQDLTDLAQRHALNDVDHLYTIVSDYMRGAISSAYAENEFLKVLLKPAQVVRLVFELDHMRDANLAPIVRAFGVNLTNAIMDMRTQLGTLSHAVKLAVSQRFPEVSLRTAAINAALQNEKDLQTRKISRQGVDKIITNASKGCLPAVDFLSMVTTSYAVRHMAMPRRPARSDGGDLLHLAYLPYCDLFRADTEVAEMVKNCAGGMGGRVVRKLEDLPRAIEERMLERGQQDRVKTLEGSSP